MTEGMNCACASWIRLVYLISFYEFQFDLSTITGALHQFLLERLQIHFLNKLTLSLFRFVLIEVVSCWCCEMFVWLTEFSTQYYFPNACSEFMIPKWFIEDTEDDKQTNKKSPLWRRAVTNGTDEGEREKWRKQKQVMKYEVVTVCCSFSLRSFCVQLPVAVVRRAGHLSHLARNTNGAVVTSTSLRTIYLRRCKWCETENCYCVRSVESILKLIEFSDETNTRDMLSVLRVIAIREKKGELMDLIDSTSIEFNSWFHLLQIVSMFGMTFIGEKRESESALNVESGIRFGQRTESEWREKKVLRKTKTHHVKPSIDNNIKNVVWSTTHIAHTYAQLISGWCSAIQHWWTAIESTPSLCVWWWRWVFGN